MNDGELEPLPHVASEAIVVLDIVDSVRNSNRFGWYALGRGLMRDLRALISRVASPRGLECRKSTGDGYLLTFSDPKSAEVAVIRAVESCFAILSELDTRNREVQQERAIHVRFAVHFGEVDVIQGDREGPNVSCTFRIEGISRDSFAETADHSDPKLLPTQDYILCSEEVFEILGRRKDQWDTASLGQWDGFSLGLFKLKGFPGYREVYRVLPKDANLFS